MNLNKRCIETGMHRNIEHFDKTMNLNKRCIETQAILLITV